MILRLSKVERIVLIFLLSGFKYIFILHVKYFLIKYLICNYSGFVFGADAIRSVILTTATVKYVITPKEAVHLSRLELEFQVKIIRKSYLLAV